MFVPNKEKIDELLLSLCTISSSCIVCLLVGAMTVDSNACLVCFLFTYKNRSFIDNSCVTCDLIYNLYVTFICVKISCCVMLLCHGE